MRGKAEHIGKDFCSASEPKFAFPFFIQRLMKSQTQTHNVTQKKSLLLALMRRTLRVPVTAFLLATFSLWSTQVRGATVYWDLNGNSAGSSSTGSATGTWDGVSAFWNDSVGTGAAAAWLSGDTAIFSAGTNSTLPYTVTVSGIQQIGGLGFEEGGVTLSGGTLQMTGASSFEVGSLLTGTVNSAVDGGFNFTKTGAGTLVLGGVNTYGGNTIINSGTLSISSDANLGTAPGSVTADSINFSGTSTLQVTGTGNPTINSNRGITVDVGVAGTVQVADPTNTVAYGGLISGVAGTTFKKTGVGTLNLQGGSTATMLGALNIDGGTLKLSGSGALAGTSGVTISNRGTLTLDNSATNLGDRTAGAITSTGGAINFIGNAAPTTETLGALTLNAGALTINNTPGVGGSALVIPSIAARAVGGTLYLNGPSSTTLSTAPALTNGILNYAVATSGSLTSFANYATSAGTNQVVVPLALASHNQGAETTWVATNNVRPTASVVLAANRLAYSLTLDNGIGWAVSTADRSLTLTGGVLQTGGSSVVGTAGGTVDNILAFGTNEALFHVLGTLQLNRGNTNTLTGTAGLTKAGAGTLILNGVSTLTTAVVGSGIHINEGILELRGATSLLPASSTAVMNLNGATLRLSNDTGTTYNGLLTVTADSLVQVDRVTAAATATTHTIGTVTINSGRTLSVNSNDINAGTGYGFTATTLNINGPVTIDVSNNGTGTGTLSTGTLVGAFPIVKKGTGDFVTSNVTTGFLVPMEVQAGRVGWANASGTVTENQLIFGAGGIVKNGAGIVNLTSTNPFTGPVGVNAGTLQFSTVSNNGGPASNLGQGTDGITMGGGVLSFIGSFSQTSNRAITLSGAATLDGSGTSGATINWSGPISTGGSGLVLTGTTGGSITGGLTQTGAAADLTPNSGTWNFSGGTLLIADDFINTGATTVINLNTTGILSYTAGASNGLYARSGATINFNATDVTGVANAGSNDFVILGDIATGGGTLNLNSFTSTITRVDVGQATAGFTGSIIGTTGSLVVTTNINLYQGTVSGNLAGAGAVLKAFGGTVTLTGDNSGLNGATATRVDSGTLILDYGTSNTDKIQATVGLDMRGGNLTLLGNAAAPTTQTVASFTLGAGGSNKITLTSNGFPTTLNLGAFTRAGASNDGTIRFIPPALGGFTTTTANTAGIIGGYATMTDGAGVTNFASNSGGNIVLATSTLQDDASLWTTGQNVSDSAGFIGTAANCLSINSLRFNANAASTVTVTPGGTLNIASGGILMTDAAVTGAHQIIGGRLTSGTNELTFTQDSAAIDLTVNSSIIGATGVTKSGVGSVTLSGSNTFTGPVDIQAGTLIASGGNAIGDGVAVTLQANQPSTFKLASNETIGTILGGNATVGFTNGVVDIGANTLTLGNGSAFAGTFSGTGTLVKNGTANLNLTGASGAAFTGNIIVNNGLLQFSGLGSANLTDVTVNKGGNFLLDKNSTTSIGNAVPDNMTITLNSADGAFSGQTVVRGLTIRRDQGTGQNETVGAVTLNSGASYASLDATATSATSVLGIDNLTRANNATFAIRGTAMSATANARALLRIVTGANQTAFISSMIGGGGALGTKTISIIPWAIAQETASGSGVGDGVMGNSLASYATGSNSFRALDFATEYNTYAASAVTTENIRESLATNLTGLTGKTINALVLHNASLTANTFNVSGTGAGQALNVTSGTMLFTMDPTAAVAAYGITLGGFDSGITVGGTNEYVVFVQNPDSANLTKALTATINSPLSSAADITKSGRGTLVLTGANTAGGGANKTTINEGTLQISNLGNIGGGSGSLVFAGGTLLLSPGFSDDVSSRGLSFLQSGGTIDTGANNLTFANSLGTGIGDFTKAGSGNLTLNASSSLTGGTNVAAGTLTMGASQAIGSGDLTVSGILDMGAFSATVSNLTLANTATAAINGSGSLTVAGNTIVSRGTINAQISGSTNLIKQTAAQTVILSNATNNYTGYTQVTDGTLSIPSIADAGVASSIGAPTGENASIRLGNTTTTGTLLYTGPAANTDRPILLPGTTGGGIIDNDGTGVLTLNGNILNAAAGAKTLTLQGTAGTLATPNVINGLIDECGLGTLSIAKAESGVWTITNPFKIGGNLTVNGATSSVLNLTSIPNSVVTIGGNLDIASAVGNNADLVYGATGGTLNVGSGSANQIRIGLAGADGTADGTLNLTGLQQFNANVGNFLISTATAGATVTTTVSVILATNNNIVASTAFTMGDSPAPGLTGTNTVVFGSGINTVATPVMTIGARKGSPSPGGNFVTMAAGGSLTLNNGVGVRSDLLIGFNNIAGSGTAPVAAVDLSGGTFNGLLNNLTIGFKAAGGTSGSGTGALTLGSGANVVDVNNVILGSVTGNTSLTAESSGTLNVGGGTFTVQNDVALAVYAGSFGAARGTLNLTGGTFTVNGNITKTAATASTGVININGGGLDMTSGAIGSSQLAWRSGTLSNVTGITLDAHAATTGTGDVGDALIIRDFTIGAPVSFTGPTSSNIHYEAAGAGAGASLAGAVDLGSAVRVFNIEDSAAAAIDLNLAGALTAAGGITKTGAGVLALTGTTTSFAGNTSVQNGRIILAGGASDRLGTTGTLTMGAGTTSGVLQLGNGTGPSSQTFTALSSSGTGTANAIVGGATSNSTLTINQASNSSYAGNLGGAGANENNLNLVKSGVGELTLTGAATYAGSTAVNGGKLFIDGITSFPATGNTGLTVADGAEFSLRGSGLVANATYGFAGTGNVLTVGSGTGTATLGFRIDGSFNTQLALATGQTMTVPTGSTFQTAIYVGNAPTAGQPYILIDGADVGSLHAGGGTFNFSPVVFNGGSFTYNLSNVTNGGTVDRWVLTPTAQPALGDVWWKGDLTGLGTGVWTASTASGIGFPTNWDDGQVGSVDAQVPPDAGSHVHFSANGAANFATTLGGNLTIKKLTFESGSITNGVSIGGGNTLTVGAVANGAGTSGITVATGAGTGTLNINTPVVLGIAQSINVEDSGSVLAFNNTLNAGTDLTINDSGTAVGTVILGQAATYAGNTTVGGGRLVLAGSNLLPASTNLTLGTATVPATLQLGSGATAGNTSIGTLSSGAATTNAILGGASVVSTLTVTQGSNASFNGSIGGAGTNENNLALVKLGTGMLTVNGAMTYTGTTTVNNGTLKLGATGSVTQSSGLTVNAVAGSTAAFDVNGRTVVLTGGITLAGADSLAKADVLNSTAGGSITLGGNITYDATNNPLGTTFAANLIGTGGNRTITVGDSTSAATDFVLSGTYTSTTDNSLTIAGAGNGTINGAISINPGGGATSSRDFNFNSTGTWTINAAVSAGDDMQINSGVINAFVNNSLNASDDIIIDGTGVQDSAIVNIGGTVTTGISQGDDIFIRNGGRINVLVNSGINTGTDQLLIGDSASASAAAAGRLDLAANMSVGANGLVLGAAGGQTGNITGTGTITTAGTYLLRNGTIDSTITLAGGGAITKVSDGTVTFFGARTATGATNLQEGALVLDYSLNNASKIGGVLTLGAVNANITAPTSLTINGNASAATSQSVTSTTMSNTGDISVNINNGTGQMASLNFGAITRNVVGSTVSLAYSSGSAGAKTLAAATTGAVGWATVTAGGTTRIAAVDTLGNIIQSTDTTQNAVNLWEPGQNIVNTSAFTGSISSCGVIASLAFDAPVAGTVIVDTGKILNITSGGILVNPSVGANTSSITGGSLYGSTTAPLGELMIHQNNTSGGLTIASRIVNSAGITKSGLGALTISNANNSFTAGSRLTINEGSVTLTGGGAIGDSTIVLLRGGTSLNVNTSETVGNIGVDNTNQSSGTITVATGQTLTINQTSDSTVSTIFAGAGNFTKAGSATITVNGDASLTGNVIINGGAVFMNGAAGTLNDAATYTLNGPVEFRSVQDQSASVNRIKDTGTVSLNNTAGGNGLTVENFNQNGARVETIGALTLGAGHNVITALPTQNNAATTAELLAASIAQGSNHATLLVRGLNLGDSAAIRKGLIRSTAAITNVGGAGIAGSTNIAIVPWMVGDLTSAGLGNSLVTYVNATQGLRPLTGAEYINDSAAVTGTLTDNVRFTTSTAITATPTAINALVIDSATGVALSGSASSMEITSGTILAAGAGAHTISGISALTSAGGRDFTVFVTNAAGSLTLSQPLSTAVPLVKSGAGTLALTATGSTYTTTFINQGTLLVNDYDKLGSGALNYFGGTLKLDTGFTDDLGGKTMVFGTGGGTIDIGANNVTATALNLSGAGNVTKLGTGMLTIGNSTTITGTGQVIVGAGTVIMQNTTGGTVGTGGLLVSGTTSPTVVQFGASNQIANTAAVQVVSNGANGQTLDLNNFSDTVGAVTITSSNTAGSVIKTGTTGTLTLGGDLILNNNTVAGSASEFQVLITGSGDLGTRTTDGTLNLGGVNRRIVVESTTASALTNDAVIETVITNGGIIKEGSRALYLNGANTYAGPTSIQQGTVVISASNNLGNASATNTITLANGSTLRSTGANVDLGANRSVNLDGVTGGTIDVTGTNQLTVSGPITGGDCLTLTKSSSGTLELTSDTNTYAGGTNVTGGTLLANNAGPSSSATGTGSVTIGAGATLGGTGTISPAVNNNITINGTLRPGDPDLGTGSDLALNVTGTGTLAMLGTVDFTLYSNNGGANPAAANSMLTVGAPDWSNLAFGTGSKLKVSLAPSVTTLGWSANTTFKLFDWISGISGTIPTPSAAFPTLDLPTLDSGLNWDISEIFTSGNISIAPEPSRALLLLFGFAGLFIRRRRRE